MTEMSPLRRRMIEDTTVRNLSPATQRSYVHAVAKFGRFFGRSPDKLDLEDVRAFQVHLVAGGMSWPALNQTVCALRFLYGVTLARPDLPERIAHAREPHGTTEVHDFGPNHMALEPVFVPRGGASDEDDGYVMAYVFDADRNASDVVVLAAQDFTGPPIAVIELPVRVPFGFHGGWSPMPRG